MSKDFTIPKQVNKFGSLNDFNGTIVLPFTRIIKQNKPFIIEKPLVANLVELEELYKKCKNYNYEWR